MSLFDLAPIPNLMTAKRVLCLQPHPDDMDIACGGTIAKLADAGAHITYLTVTDGGAGSAVRTNEDALANQRRGEQQAAGQILGVSDYVWLDYRDAKYISAETLQNDFIRAIREVKPDTVITIDGWLPYEAHPAHRNVGLAAAAAALFSGMGNIGDDSLAPHSIDCIAFAFTARPNTFVDVTGTWDRKVEAIRSHASQFPDQIWPFFGQYFSMKATEYGDRIQVEKAEALKVLAPLHLHCNVDVQNM